LLLLVDFLHREVAQSEAPGGAGAPVRKGALFRPNPRDAFKAAGILNGDWKTRRNKL
jgi:hypothetical protein